MTPKDKAQYIFDKFWNVDNLGRFSDEHGYSSWSTIVLKQQAKECALIAVDEVLSTMDEEDNYVMYKYWTEVKQKIEKL